jgi:hypothetical protein
VSDYCLSCHLQNREYTVIYSSPLVNAKFVTYCELKKKYIFGGSKLRFLTPLYCPEKKIGIFFYFAFIVTGTVIYNETSNNYLKDWYNWVFIVVGILIPLIGFVGMQKAYYILFPSYIIYIFFILPLPSENTGGVDFLILILFTPLYFFLVTAVAFVLESIAQAYRFYK